MIQAAAETMYEHQYEQWDGMSGYAMHSVTTVSYPSRREAQNGKVERKIL